MVDGPLKSKLRKQGIQAFAHRLLRGFVNEYTRPSDVFASCLTCRNIQTEHVIQPWCKKYQQYPPLEILVNSCIVGYDDHDEIPF